VAGSMTRPDLVADLKRSLHDAGSVFNAAGDADWLRFLAIALVAMQTKRPRTLLGTVTLIAEQDRYTIDAADFATYKTHSWGGRPPKPWAPEYPGALPRVSVAQEGTANVLVFDPAPTMKHINAYGSVFRFWYFGTHTATDTTTTLAPVDRPLLLLRAQAEALRELTMRNINKPVSLRDGLSGTPRNSTPAALFQALLQEWEAAR